MNLVKGEQRLTVGTVEYLLRPENNALANIEGRLNTGLLDLIGRFVASKARNADVAVVIQECSRAGGKELPYPQAFDFTLEDFATANRVALQVLLARWGKEKTAGKDEATAGS